MELFQELIFTVALSLFFSFILAKLLSMASSCDVAEDNTVSTSKPVMCEQKHDKESVVCDFESERRVGSVEEAVKVNDYKEVLFRVGKIETRESPLIEDDNAVVSREFEVGGLGVKDMERSFCKEEMEDVGCEKEEKVCVGGDEVAENVDDESYEMDRFLEIEIQSVKEIHGRSEFRQTDIELVKDGAIVAKSREVPVLVGEGSMGNESDEVFNNEDDNEDEELIDDWEGIERTELEKRFGSAVVFVGSKSNADRISLIDNDVKMILYGLHKIATEGPCCEPQPMALKVSARAKWFGWKQLGNMNPEVAMEQYITILSTSVPDWMRDDTCEDSKQDFLDVGTSGKLPSILQKQK